MHQLSILQKSEVQICPPILITKHKWLKCCHYQEKYQSDLCMFVLVNTYINIYNFVVSQTTNTWNNLASSRLTWLHPSSCFSQLQIWLVLSSLNSSNSVSGRRRKEQPPRNPPGVSASPPQRPSTPLVLRPPPSLRAFRHPAAWQSEGGLLVQWTLALPELLRRGSAAWKWHLLRGPAPTPFESGLPRWQLTVFPQPT